MEHDARSVANELIRRAHDAGRPINPMQVLKLAYYCHAWMLGLYHRPFAPCWISRSKPGGMAR